ncbi:hypothetical protein P7C73_g2726, partial [Tremellales sp. Uapishka_1]
MQLPTSIVRAHLRVFSRALHSSPRRLASEVRSNPIADPALKDFYDKIQGHPGAQAALAEIGRLMQAKGIDTTKVPSTMQMMKLAVDSDIRAAGQKVVEELKSAGIDITPQNAMEVFSKLKKD